MRNTIRVQVTQEDIDNANAWVAKREESGVTLHCPVALAAQRAMDNRHIRAGLTTCADRTLPTSARAFIALWDAGNPVEPFEFEL